MRILIVSHPPATRASGAGQVALELADALAAQGHEPTVWSPEPRPDAVRWWRIWRWQRQRLEEHLAASGPYDVIDTPAVSLSPRVAAAGFTVARSVQPDLLYSAVTLREQARRSPLSPRVAAHALHAAVVSAAIVRGWRRADLIVALGEEENQWLARRFPWTSNKLRSYRFAPPAAERDALRRVLSLRRERAAAPSTRGDEGGVGGGVRYLWIGRWVPQKGIRRLVDFLVRRLGEAPHDRFTLAGAGGEAAAILPPALLAERRVEVIPSFSRTELPGLLAAHDAGLFTSEVEGWGLTLNEMLESGLPIFATRAGAVRDLEPYFPRHLLPFPPPLAPGLPEPPSEAELAAYTERFAWRRIAAEYATWLPAVAGGPP